MRDSQIISSRNQDQKMKFDSFADQSLLKPDMIVKKGPNMITNESVYSPGRNNDVEFSKTMDMASESMLQSTMQEAHDANISQIDGS